MSTSTVTLSNFVQQPTSIIALLEQGDVVLTRREGASLRLIKNEEADLVAQSLATLAQVLPAVMGQTESAIEAQFQTVFPWLAIHDKKYHAEFIQEYLETARRCLSLNQFTQLAVCVESWKDSALLIDSGVKFDRVANADRLTGKAVSRPK